jgi:TPR repeat protein
MADLARDAPGPAPPKPGDAALQHTSRAGSPDKGKLRVFISYSRDDLDFADQLNAALEACGFECFIDRHGISGGEDWKRRLGNLISEADTVIFVLSPASARSDICAWEVEEAARLGKRILPVNCRPLKGADPPPRLRDLNYIFFYADTQLPGSGFGTGLASLIAALSTDFDWLREHTRYLQRATEWNRGGRPANRLLSGDDIAEAKAWAARRPQSAPEPTALHLDFFRASELEAEAQSSAQRKQLDAMAAVQAERETALNKAEEALKRAADAQRKRARIRNVAFVVVSFFAVLAGWLYLNAELQREQAELQRAQANEILAGAQEIVADVFPHLNPDTKKQVFALLQQGADRGDSTSMRNLGFLYRHGHGVPQDYVKAREWFAKAAAKGSASALRDLGRIYVSGQGVEQDYVKAREWFEKAAAMDDATALRDLAMLYANGLGVPQDYVKAREWYERAAAKDDASAMHDLGLLYANGQGVAQDYAKAREWYEKAAAKDNADAMHELGLLYANGQGVTQDSGKAREWYERAAANANANSMRNLGLLYANGQGVAQDYAKAREWYEKAAAKDNEYAMHDLGLLYANGRGVAQDYPKAREWYERAAAKDNEYAMHDLGLLYYFGQGVAQDYTKAHEWYERAAAKDNDYAMVSLGLLYANGQGVAQNYVKAREWFEKAAAKDNVIAKIELAKLSITEAATAGRYAEALQLQAELAENVEAVETKREGKPGEDTAEALQVVAWYALFAREFTRALTAADRAHALLPDSLPIETNRAHALMFLGREGDSKALYFAHKGRPILPQSGKLWERVIVDDFAELRQAGLTHPMMAEIENELGVSR